MIPTLWNGPVGHCASCGAVFTYLESFAISGGHFSGSVWTPKDRCGACGGHYQTIPLAAAAHQ